MKVVAALILSILAGLPAIGWTQTKLAAAPEYVLDIPQMPLVNALKEFSTQTGLQIGFWPDVHTDEAGLTYAIKGEYTAESALATLLSPSGLAVRRINERALVVIAPSLMNLPRNSEVRSRQYFQLPRQTLLESLDTVTAQTGTKLNTELLPGNEGGTPVRPLEGLYTIEEAVSWLTAGIRGMRWAWMNESTIRVWVETPPISQADPTMLAAVGDSPTTTKPEVIFVTGSRIAHAAPPQVAPAPIVVFDQARIRALGASTVGDILFYAPQQPFHRARFFYGAGQQYAQLRGIGLDTTLVLVNGRRVVTSANSVARNAVDLRNFPLAAVERVELLSDSASAIYGADAIGGVINIILKDNIAQPVLDIEYSTPQGGGELRRASFVAGYATERFRSSLILDYAAQNLLTGAKRALWRNQDYRVHGGTDYRLPSSNPGTVSSIDGAHLPGLSSSFAAVPAGSTGIGMTPADFSGTAGQRNYSSDLTYSTLIPESINRSALLTLELDLSRFSLFTQFFASQNDTRATSAPYALEGTLVPAANPFNPFGTDVLVDYLMADLGPQITISENSNLRGTAGLRGALRSWLWEISVLASDEKQSSVTVGRVNPGRVATSLASTDAAQALNLFTDGPAGSAMLLASLAQPEHAHSSSSGYQASAVLRGALAALPWGDIHAAIGGEWRHDSVLYDATNFGITQIVDRGRDARAAFAEARIPISGELSTTPDASGAYVNLAARLDAYSDFGITANPQVGVVWRPIPSLLLRSSYGTSFRPPSLFELYTPRQSIPGVRVPDPSRGNEIGGVTVVTGGNPDLAPVDAKSFTGGFVWSPANAPGLHLLASYWSVHAENRVAGLPYFRILDNEDTFGNRVIRAERTDADVAAGRPGRLLQVDISRVNFGRIETRGIDLDARYRFESSLGGFNAQLAATWVDEYSTVDFPGMPSTNRVGIANHLEGTIPRWRAVCTLGWTRGAVGLSTAVTWIPSYRDATPIGQPTGRRLPSQATVDLQVTFDVSELSDSPLMQDLGIAAGAKNALDAVPHFAEAGGPFGIDTTQGDLTQRVLYLKLTKGF